MYRLGISEIMYRIVEVLAENIWLDDRARRNEIIFPPLGQGVIVHMIG